MRQAIEAALGPLVGQPLWAVGRAGSLAWFHFGDHHMVPDRRSGAKDVGSYALHVDCPWSWTTKWGDMVADNESGHVELSALPSLPVTPRAVEVQDDGAFSMTFDDDSRLSVEPDPAPDVEEYWRLFEPHLETRHFVVGPSGVEA